MPGWLGPWGPEELADSLQFVPFPCHKTIPQGEENVPLNDPRLKGCAGAAIFLNNKNQVSRTLSTAAHQDEVIDIPQEEKDKVFANRDEFVTHHRSLGHYNDDKKKDT